MKKTTLNASVTSSATSKVHLDDLAACAISKVQSGHYKEAIELYKTLLKTAENLEWRQKLAHCYLQRALSFAAKGMLKEAVVLWENYAGNNKAERHYFDHYILWLLQSHDINKAKKCIQQLTTQQLDEQYTEFAAILGLLILTNKLDVRDVLPADSIFIRHLISVQASLTAYRANQLDSVDAHLKTLPFRSAFKDFKILMKATLLSAVSIENAQVQLAKIPAKSPYRNMANSILACTRNGAALINAVTLLLPKQIHTVGSVKKINKKQIELLDIIVKQKGCLSDKIKFNLTIQYQELLDTQLAKRYCYFALADYPAGQRDFVKQFGSLDEFEECRLKALNYERKNNTYDALYYWKRCVTILKNQEPVDNVKIALLLQNIADKEYMFSECIAKLEESLHYVPDDRDCYVRILRSYEQAQQDSDKYHYWLMLSLKQFPQDVDFLLLAIKNAINRQDFEHVEQYAKIVLSLDPVNIVAKQTLFSNQSAKIKFLIKSKCYENINTEIHVLQTLALHKQDQLTLSIMQGFCEFATGDKSRGALHIAMSVQQLHPGLLIAHTYTMIDASVMGLQLASVLKGLPPLAKDYLASTQELSQFITLISQCVQKNIDSVVLCKIIDKVKSPIKFALNCHKDESNILLAFLQCMNRINNFELMRACTKTQDKSCFSPIWAYYYYYSNVNGDATKCEYTHIVKLEFQLDSAIAQKDERAVVLIEKFLDEYYADTKDGAVSDNISDVDETGAVDLFRCLPKVLWNKLDEKASEIMKKISVDHFLSIIIKKYFNADPATAAAILTDVSIIQGFLFLKAAEELKIDVHVTAADIINYAKAKMEAK